MVQLRCQNTDLVQHTYKVVEQVFLSDFTLLISVSHGTEIHFEAPVCRGDDLAVIHRPGTLNRAGKFCYGAGSNHLGRS
jgi:hypothetical protein